MAFPVIGGTQESGYNIDNSLRFNDDDSAYLSRTPSTATNDDKLTFSFWAKRCTPFANHKILTRYSSADNRFYIGWANNDKLYIYQKVGGTESFNLQTNRLFRDPSAWYHIVVAFDTTQGTDSNRIKLYVNGTQETSFSTSNYPTQNLDLYYQTATSVLVKIGQYDSSQYYDGYFSDMYLIDGQQLAPTEFGETDDNGVWIPKNYTGSYGTTGFKLEFKQLGTAADATSIGADTSGNDNHFSQTNVTPALDRTEDTPTNNFCTMNPLDVGSDLRDNGSFAEGNLEVTNGATSGQADQQRVRGTIAVTQGKWYFEMKNLANTASIGLLATEAAHGGTSANSMLVEYNNGGEIRFYNGSGRTTLTTGINTFTTNDILGCALDMDNRRAYFHKNGTYQGDPTPDPASSPSGSGQHAPILSGFTMAPCMFDNSSGNAGKGSFNFGNPAFSISSGNSDANGHGNFEYAVPSGYFALCTKNLTAYG